VDELGFLSAFVVGLLGGVHCVGMCGGIVGALSFAAPGESRNKWPLMMGYNAGRMASYALAGAIAGGLGLFFSGLLPVQQAQNILLGFAAVFMMLLGLYLAGWSALLLKIERSGGILWKHIEPFGRRFLPARTAAQAMALGVLWGWLPCGLVYSVLVWAISAGGILEGALLMLAFALGTLPNLLLMGVAASQLQRFVQRTWVRQLAGSLIFIYGVLLMLRSL